MGGGPGNGGVSGGANTGMGQFGDMGGGWEGSAQGAAGTTAGEAAAAAAAGSPISGGQGPTGLGSPSGTGIGEGQTGMPSDNPNDFNAYGQSLPSFAQGQHGTPIAAYSGEEGENVVSTVLDVAKNIPVIGPLLGAFVSTTAGHGQPSGDIGDIGGPGGIVGPGADPNRSTIIPGYQPQTKVIEPPLKDYPTDIGDPDDDEITPDDIRKEARRRRGRGSTILTGPQGLLYRPNVKRPTLLGF